MLYQMTSTDIKGEERHFEKPLFLTFVMFVAMACALPIYYVQQVGWVFASCLSGCLSGFLPSCWTFEYRPVLFSS